KFMVQEQVVEDCIQDLFLQLWQNRLQINETESVKHYLLKALRHHIMQYHRAKSRYTTEDLDWDASIPEEFDAETLLIHQESLRLLTQNMQTQLDKLPVREREALYLRYYENLSIPEIAEVMQVNRQSVSNFLQKALLKIRKRWLETALILFCI
ncbi:RNA polymerase sigma factor, partial [Arsenicibacter rosenii]